MAHEDGKADYRAELGSLASAGADKLVVLAYADGSGQTIIRQALEGGDFSKFAGGDGMVGDSLVKAHRRRQARRLHRRQIGRSETPGTRQIIPSLPRPPAVDPAALIRPAGLRRGIPAGAGDREERLRHREGLSKALREVATAPGEPIHPANGKRRSS